ncbi:MAG TPA: hypothetical protein VHC91_15230 [Trinickia sp.]|uniref:hypothetical protein n=1 Tax=Trinickia sp. TaxID=2571163 RepID=UPI002C2DFFFB|nr:hypothetical protein [Trinickia sp.]HVW51726.1 hypothetical protein [Trinickia sp.]
MLEKIEGDDFDRKSLPPKEPGITIAPNIQAPSAPEPSAPEPSATSAIENVPAVKAAAQKLKACAQTEAKLIRAQPASSIPGYLKSSYGNVIAAASESGGEGLQNLVEALNGYAAILYLYRDSTPFPESGPLHRARLDRDAALLDFANEVIAASQQNPNAPSGQDQLLVERAGVVSREAPSMTLRDQALPTQ